jgi:SH3-like domain-containing protein
LAAGDKVKVIATEGAWSQIANEQGEALGWMHSSALQRRALSLNPDGETATVEATSDELALAGRGFNSEVESEFKKNNADLPFDQIDALESRGVSRDEAVKFLQAGGLLEGETEPEEAAPADAPAEGGEP